MLECCFAILGVAVISEFNAVTALVGGLLIGAGAVVLMLTNGRILGVSGIVGGVVGEPGSEQTRWRLAFIAGMVTPGAVLGLMGKLSLAGAGVALPVLLVAGFLVGFGSRMGNGCTSGHGICGLSRLSKRSMAAVATFMAVCAITVFVTRHLLSLGV
ncbi:MAG: YeeE/YedE family protein [Alphaproteobacteria bacterium]|nr:YeeE/YedE family protein [Alphaproteobacteria bacterium]